MNEDEWPMRELRFSRADPPGFASDNPLRRSIYTAALQQFEELLAASQVSGFASKPLPMFYALSQAGRAIVAARGEGEEFEIRGHGLAENHHDFSGSDVLDRSIVRRARRAEDDAFGLVSRATGSGEFGGELQLGAIWAATPDLHKLPVDSWQPDWTPWLYAEDLGPDYPYSGVAARIICWSRNPTVPAEATLDRYPSFTEGDARLVDLEDGSEWPAGGWHGEFAWHREGVQLDEALPTIGLDGGRRIIPLLPGQSELISPLMSVWLLLFGFSIYARYNPNLWREALHVDSSLRAVPLEAAMERIERALPRLVYEAVLRPDPE